MSNTLELNNFNNQQIKTPPQFSQTSPPITQLQPNFNTGSQTGIPNGAQPGFPAGAQTGIPNGAQPGFPAGAQPGFPTGAQPGFPTGAQPGFHTNVQPGFPTGAQPGGQNDAQSKSINEFYIQLISEHSADVIKKLVIPSFIKIAQNKGCNITMDECLNSLNLPISTAPMNPMGSKISAQFNPGMGQFPIFPSNTSLQSRTKKKKDVVNPCPYVPEKSPDPSKRVPCGKEGGPGLHSYCKAHYKLKSVQKLLMTNQSTGGFPQASAPNIGRPGMNPQLSTLNVVQVDPSKNIYMDTVSNIILYCPNGINPGSNKIAMGVACDHKQTEGKLVYKLPSEHKDYALKHGMMINDDNAIEITDPINIIVSPLPTPMPLSLQPNSFSPGMTQPSSFSPGMTQPSSFPPGMTQPSSFPPGMSQPNSFPPGMSQPSSLPPGIHQPNSLPPGIHQPNSFPPGMHQPNSLPPGIHQPNSFPPGMHQPNSLPPGIHQPNSFPLGIPQQSSTPQPVPQQSSEQQSSTPQQSSEQQSSEQQSSEQQSSTPQQSSTSEPPDLQLESSEQQSSATQPVLQESTTPPHDVPQLHDMH